LSRLRALARPAVQAALAGLAAAALSLAFYGYAAIENPQDVQFRPTLETRLDPGLYPRDAYVSTLDRIPSFFWTGVAAASKASGAEPDGLLFFLYVASTAALYGLVFALANESAGPAAGWGAVALTLVSTHLRGFSLMAHDGMLRSHVDQTTIAWPFLLGALLLRLRGRKAAAFACTGLAFNLNPFFAADVAACMLLCELIESRGRRILEAARLGGVFLLFGAPVAWKIARLPPPGISSADWAALLRLWYPFHYFPSSWPVPQWIYIFAHGGALACLFVAAFRRTAPNRDWTIFGASLLLMWLGYSFFSEVVPYRPFILTQALRTDTLATLLSLVAASVIGARLLRAGPEGVAWVGLLWTGLANPHRSFFPMALLLPPAFQWAAGDEPVEKSLQSMRGFAGAAALFSASRLALGTGVSVLYPIESAVLFSVFGLLAWARPTRERGRAAGALLAVAVAVMLAECGVSQARARRLDEAGIQRKELREIGGWLRSHTPKDALVLAAPYFSDLRLVSQRSQVAQYVDDAALHWDPDFGPECKRRLEELGYRFDLEREHFKEVYLGRFPLLERRVPRFRLIDPWDADRQRMLLEKYRPDYVVMPDPPVDGLVPMLKSGSFTVYRVER
jgi:hypothetical protein